MTKYAYLVGADYKYVPELCALLNSLDYVENKFDFHVLGIHLPEEFTNQFNKLGYEVIYHNISEEEIQTAHGISEITCRKRYWYAGDIGKDYNAICVLDADLIFNRNPWQFFEIAEKTGFILGVTKEQNKVYDDPHHTFNGEYMITKGFWNDKDLCNCPLFLDARIWETPLKQSFNWFVEGFPKTNMKCPDMDCMNIAFIKYNAHDKIVKLPGLQWLGTNEQHLKPYIRVTERRDKQLWTENGLEIFCYHGHYYHQKWRDCQLANRHRCAEGYLGYSRNTDNMAQGVMHLLYSNFKKMLDYKIKIEQKNYRV